MTNEEIIRQAALEHGILSEMQIVELMDNSEEIPLHTIQGWAERGKRKGLRYKVRKGEHGIKVKLWKRKKSDGKGNNEFYQTTAYLFSDKQIEIMNEE